MQHSKLNTWMEHAVLVGVFFLFAKKGVMYMKNGNKAVKAYEINKKLRKSWDINPVTRIKEDERRNKKKMRQKNKNEIKRFNINGFD